MNLHYVNEGVLMRISVLGSGRWGSFIAWYAHKIGHEVLLWGRPSERFELLKKERKNRFVILSNEIELVDSIEKALAYSDILVIAISAQQLRGFSEQINQFDLRGKTFILNMKGLENTTGKRLTTVFKECIKQENCQVAVWLGPGHVQDFVQGIPNCMIMGSENFETTKKLVEIFKSDLIRFYYAQDMIGNEIGAATKNVIGIAAGMLDGANLSSLKGALMARGTSEVSRLIKVMGGSSESAYGLAHLGDYEATLFSPHSNNRQFGEKFVRQESFDKLAEGVYTIQALVEIEKLYHIELPIAHALYEVIFEKKPFKEVMKVLFDRTIKFE